MSPTGAGTTGRSFDQHREQRVERQLTKLTRQAGVSAPRLDGMPSLEQIERRRFELWLFSTVLIVGMTIAALLLSMWPGDEVHRLLSRPVVRYGSTSLAVVICGYLIEKEVRLRRLSRLLFGERMLTVALSNRLKEITALLDAGRAVNSALELEQVLAAILRGSLELLPANVGSIMLLEGEELVVAAAVGRDDAIGARLPIGDGVAGHVARTRQPLLLDGDVSASLFPGYVERKAGAPHSSLCTPLIERGELLGILSVSADVENAFSEYDLRAVSLFAEHAATAIAKARLYESHRRHAAELAYRAGHDALTSLPNRTTLEQTVRADLAGARPMALLFVDLDGFKDVNDNFGHLTGDRLLQAAAARVQSSLSRDDVPARLGGDEFAIALRGVDDAAVAQQVAVRIVEALSAPFTVDGHTLRISASLGIAVAGLHGDDFTVLLRAADRALYAAKGAGKNCCCVLDAESHEPFVLRATKPLLSVPRPRAEELPAEARVTFGTPA
jgi:diguanylate cyclase (GGDEF)-like protein